MALCQSDVRVVDYPTSKASRVCEDKLHHTYISEDVVLDKLSGICPVVQVPHATANDKCMVDTC